MGRMSDVLRFPCVSLWTAEARLSPFLAAGLAQQKYRDGFALENGDRLGAGHRLSLRRALRDEPPGDEGRHDQEEGSDHQRNVEPVHERKAKRVVHGERLL